MGPLKYVCYTETVSMEHKMRKVVKALCDNVLTDDGLCEFRSKPTERWMRVEEDMMGEVQPFMPLEMAIKTNEVLPARDKAPRPIITSGDRGQFMAALTMKAIEKSFSTYFADANIKGKTKGESMWLIG